MTLTPDQMPTLLDLAAENDPDPSICDLATDTATDTSEAGTLNGPARDATDLTEVAVTAIDLLLAEVDWRGIHVLNVTPPGHLRPPHPRRRRPHRTSHAPGPHPQRRAVHSDP